MNRLAPILELFSLLFWCSAQTMSIPLGDDPSKFDEKLEASALRNDLTFFQVVLSGDVRFTHGTGLVQDRPKWLDEVLKARSFMTRT